MTKPAVISATFEDMRQIRGRKALQLVFEVPIERMAEVIAALGCLNPESPPWVAIARLKEEPKGVTSTHTPAQPTEKPVERRRFEDLPVGQQAAMRCQEPVFRAFLQETFDLRTMPSEEGAADILREHFRVLSRSDIPAELWTAFDRHYLAWKAKEAA